MRRSTTLVAGVIAALALMLAPAATAAISTNDMNSLTASDLANALVGSGVSVSNATFSGSNVAGGTFAGGASAIGFESGIILSSGAVASVPGPNGSDSTTASNGVAGDADLTALAGFATLDAAILEFDFVPNAGTVTFQYVFASEEYNEYVNSQFNDVFGFFVNGVNVALLPDNVTPVSINNVNCGNPVGDPTPHNCAYFINNACQGPPGYPDVPYPCAPPLQTEMDGMTVVFNVFTTVDSGLNHIRLAVADAGDPVLDSNVFIRTQSFTCTPPGTTGACCLPSGLCDDETAADCAEDGGVFHPETDCDQFSCTACTGDVDGDGQVAVTDLLDVLGGWGPNPGDPADINGDGTVDVIDLLLLLAAWGPCSG